jgi:tRNA-dihydrouridine synthase
MNYYTAPMEGLTDRIWRQAHQRWFGAPGAPARYYAPFISPPENRVLIKKKMAELDPAANPGAPVIPQLLAKDGALAAWMIGELRKMGYTEVNLNFGCPSGTVTAKGKGAGMLRDLSKLEVFLDEVFSQAEGPISVKTRLGVTSPEEFEAILDLYDRYPICELTIHPRVMRQLYRGEADRAAFAAALPRCTMPVCYNGDVTTAAQLHALEKEFPALSGIMVGRGLIADPALFRKARGGAPATKEELRGYLTDLYHGYTELFGSAGCAISRMKGHWFYLIHCFAGAEKLEKQLKKLREPWEYEVVVNQIFTLPLVEND